MVPPLCRRRKRDARRHAVLLAAAVAATTATWPQAFTSGPPRAARVPTVTAATVSGEVAEPTVGFGVAGALGAVLGGPLPAYAAEGTPPVVGGVNVIDAAHNVFYFVIFVLFLKNNLVDHNGPLAGFFGTVPRSCTASHILVESEEEALRLLGELRSSEAGAGTAEHFARLSKAHSTCPTADKGGDMGKILEGQMVKEFNDIVFDDSKPVGMAHGPVQSKFGWHLVWVSERSPATAQQAQEAQVSS